MEYPMCNQSVKRKKILLQLAQEKVSYSYGSLRISRLANFKNKSFSSVQGVVQIKPNLVWSIPGVGRLCDKTKRIFGIACLGKKLVGSRSCSKWTKLISQTTSTIQVVMQKNGPPNFHSKKVRISIGNIDFFAY